MLAPDVSAAQDTNKDGVLSFEEAKAGLQGKVPPPQYRAIFDKYDADGSNSLDLKEFTKLCKALDGVALSAAAGLGRGGSVIDNAWCAAPTDALTQYTHTSYALPLCRRGVQQSAKARSNFWAISIGFLATYYVTSYRYR